MIFRKPLTVLGFLVLNDIRHYYRFKSPRDYNYKRKPSEIQGVLFFNISYGTLYGTFFGYFAHLGMFYKKNLG